MTKFLKHGKRVTAFLLAVLLAETILPTEYLGGMFPEKFVGNVKADTTLSNPRIEEDSSMAANQKVTWDCIWFGSYPQIEIVDQASTCGTYGRDWEEESDYEVNANLYNILQNATGWDSNGDITIGGGKYRRIKKSDATYSSMEDHYYNWFDSSSYHYFRYEPIKWRVLNVSDGEAFLLADKSLDDQSYNTVKRGVTWESSTLRSWINGYGTSENVQRIDFSSNNFIKSAFSSGEQSAIITANVVNEDNSEYGTDGGNNTNDRIFLLAESEVYNTEKAKSYGFVTDKDIYDEARRSKSTTYAKAMGMWNRYNDGMGCDGNCWWWLRSPGQDDYNPIGTSFGGYVYTSGNCVIANMYGVRPALILNFSSSNLWSWAGTVSSDGSSNEQAAPGSGGDSGSSYIDSEHCGIIFSDYNTGKEIKGVTFTYNGVRYTSKDDGSALVVVPNFTNKLNTTFSANGYMDYKVSDVELIRGGALNITLVPVADKPTVYRCEMQYDGSSSTVDVLKKSKTLAEGSKKKFSLTAVAGYKDEIAKYQLINDGEVIKESTSGVFTGLTASSFKVGTTICIRAAGKKGRGYVYGSTQKLQLKVKDNILADSKTKESISIGDKVSIKVDSDIPILGGNELSFDFGELPVYYETDGSKCRMGINIGRVSASSDGDGWEGTAFRGFTDENWKELKDSIKKHYTPKEFMKKNKEAKKIFKTQGVLFAEVGSTSADADVWGYLETDANSNYVSGEISITASIEASTENQFAAGSIPMVLTVKLKGAIDEGTVKLTASSGMTSLKDLDLTGTVEPSIGLDVGVGPGMAKLASITVNGNGTLSYNYKRTIDLSSHKVDLTAKMYLKIKALAFEFKKNFAKKTWVLYNESKSVRIAGTAETDLMNPDRYELADRSYLEKQSSWNPALKTRAAQVKNADNYTTKVLQTSVYDDPQLKILQTDDLTMMVFLTDDPDRSSINRTKLVYSIYDEQTGSWGIPQAVEDDKTADFMPVIASDDTSIYVAWVNMKSVFPDDASQEAFASGGEISLARYNGTTFEVTDITDNDSYDTMPALSVDNTGVNVTWMNSESNNILGNDSKNSLYYYDFSDKTTICIADNLDSVKENATGTIAGQETIAYISDTDQDYSTTDDQTIKILDLEGNELWTQTGTGEISQLMYKEGGLIWNENGSLMMLNDAAGVDSYYHGFDGRINSAYQLLDTDMNEYLICLDNVRDENDDITDVEMYAYVYDKGTEEWSEKSKITSLGNAVQDYAMFFDSEGAPAGVLGINEYTYENDIYSNSMNLYALNITPMADYELLDVYYSDIEKNEEGECQLYSTIDMKNAGIKDGGDFTIDLMDGKDVISSVSASALLAGKSRSKEVVFTLPELPAENSQYTILLNEETDLNPDNNSKTITLGYSNLSVSCEDVINGDIHRITTTITNDSLYDVDGATLLLCYDENGEEIASEGLGTVGAQEKKTFVTEIDANKVSFNGDSKLIFAKVTSDSSELTEEDNSDFFSIDKPVGSVALPDDNTVVDEGGTDIDIKPGDTGSTGNIDTGKKPGTPSKSQLLRITLSGISKQIAAGKKIKLTAHGIPVGAPLPNLTWTSSNPKVATVTQTGIVTLKKNTGGKTVTITATAADGSGISASWKIKSMKGVVKKVTVSGAKTVKAGKSLKLKAKVTATKGANKKLQWTSSNTKYATVSSSGKVKILKAGKGKKVKITAMATDGSNKKKTVTIKIK